MKLSLVNYFSFLMAGKNSRCVAEGEEVFNAGHIILCGKVEQSTNCLKIVALCLQTSALTEEPHRIDGCFKISDEFKIDIDEMKCTCKAGMGGRCKHISAVLIFCTRKDIENFETISQTDLKCVWGKQKHIFQNKTYKAVPLKDMPCLKDKYLSYQESEYSELIRSRFIEKLPKSSLSIHSIGRRTIGLRQEGSTSTYKEFNTDNIINNACQSILMMELESLNINLQDQCCRVKYNSLFNDCDINQIMSAKQKSKLWLDERRYRITGSRIYEIHTYAKDDWARKAITYFYPKSFTNKYIKHGIKYEDEAVQEFVALGFTVETTGMIVSSSNPWLAYSPDGIVFEDSYPSSLLEVKCIFSGATKPIMEAIKDVPFIEFDGDFKLKKRHKYYGQVQLGMAILNLKLCHFLVYASFDKSFIVMSIPFDEDFCRCMLYNTKRKYFENMFHYICTYEA